MKLDYNPKVPLNLTWVNFVFSKPVLQDIRKQTLFAEFKKYWQLSLDLNQSFRARYVHHVLAEKYARELFDTWLRP